MKVEGMNELESAIVELVDKYNGLLHPGDVQAKMMSKGWKSTEVATTVMALLGREILSQTEGGLLRFDFPEEIPYLDQIQQVLESHLTPKSSGVAVGPGHDPVNSPSHYTRGGIEAIDFIEAKGLGFCLGNVVKYVSRAGFKADARVQDLEKAQWYLTREIARMKKGE